MVSIVMQNIQIFYGGPVMFVATCSVAMLLLSLKQVFWNKSAFYVISTILLLIPKFQNKAVV